MQKYEKKHRRRDFQQNVAVLSQHSRPNLLWEKRKRERRERTGEMLSCLEKHSFKVVAQHIFIGVVVVVPYLPQGHGSALLVVFDNEFVEVFVAVEIV